VIYAFVALLAWAILTIWIPERWAWSLFQLGVFALTAWRVRRWDGRLMTVLAAAAVWPWIQLAAGTTLSRDATHSAALDWLTYLAVFALGCEMLREEGAREQFLDALALFGGLVAAQATLQLYTPGGRVFWLFPSGFIDGVLGPFVNRNQYSAWIELLLPVAAWRAAVRPRGRWLFLAAAAVMYGSVVAGASRAGFVLVTAELLAVILVVARARLRWVMGAAASTAALLMGWQNLQMRLTASAPEMLRAEGLRASISIFRDHPLVGVGLGAWPVVYPAYAAFDAGVVLNQAHNDWAQWTAEGGIPFLLAMALFTALLWKRAIPSIYGLGTVAFLLHALVDYPMQQRPALAAWFFAVAAAVSAPIGNGLLRRTGRKPGRTGRGNPPGIPPPGTVAASGPLHR
jgi:hypothetical protein